MSEYGEPWHTDFDGVRTTFLEMADGTAFNPDLLPEYQERIVACVNSLAGIPNPEAVRELIEAARNWKEKTWTDHSWASTCLAAAIAKLDSAPSAGAQQK